HSVEHLEGVVLGPGDGVGHDGRGGEHAVGLQEEAHQVLRVAAHQRHARLRGHHRRRRLGRAHVPEHHLRRREALGREPLADGLVLRHPRLAARPPVELHVAQHEDAPHHLVLGQRAHHRHVQDLVEHRLQVGAALRGHGGQRPEL
uniref:Uncharacterized protein n=1 Tax=Triticum urartu TaxID=4572 RepID=A0A8R7Q0E8_TRIUA